jgi:protein MpaA
VRDAGTFARILVPNTMNNGCEFMLRQRSHDFGHLLERWEAVARDAGLTLEELTEVDGYPLIGICGRDPGQGAESIYLSAGIHGDEPGAVEGLVRWAEANVELLRRLPVVIFPCLNPWGLVNNSRGDRRGRDLNRLFDRPRVRPISDWRRVFGCRRYAMGLCLHEDYDAQGIYVYELLSGAESIGERLLKSCDGILPRYPGGDLYGHPIEDGRVHHPAGMMEEVVKEIDGMPEAIYLHLNGTRLSLTFETPSEYSLFDRVRVQERAVAEAVKIASAIVRG